MKIVITGSLGFIATNLIFRLAENGYQNIIGIDGGFSNSSNIKYTEQYVSHYQADLRNIDTFKDYFKGADLIIHLAASGNVIDSIANPLCNFDHNVIATLNVLEAMRAAGVKRIIFSSTGGALMGNTPPPVSEWSLPSPISPYGASKLACEGYVRAYCNSYGFSSILFRFGNVFGPFSLHKKGVVNDWISKMIKNADIIIYGDGSSSRDYIYVDDICSGIILGIQKEIAFAPGLVSTYHLATSVETSLLNLFNILQDISGSQSQLIFENSRTSEVYQNCSSFELAQNELGFRPKDNLFNQLKSTYYWIKSNL